jgi:hypothetical protein
MARSDTAEDIKCPRDTGGWKVRDTDAGRYFVRPDGRVYREMQQREGAKPEAVIRYSIRPHETWLRLLGPRQAREALPGLYKAE